VFDIAWQLPPDQATRTADFMSRHALSDYRSLAARAVEDPDWFWDSVVEFLGIPFRRRYSAVRSEVAGKEWTTWFTDGLINLSEACVDRWSEAADVPAVIGEREDGTSTTLTFAELHDLVGRLAGGLSRLGVSPGDAVAVFLPMSPEAIVAFLAAARIGAIFVPIFSGYGPDAIASRLVDPKPKVMITPDGFIRRGRLVAAKEVADAAVEAAGGIDHVVVLDYAGCDVNWSKPRDVRWTDLIAGQPVDAVATQAEAPVLLAYTSGTTGRPKGSVHVHGGLTVKLAQEGAFQGDFLRGDRVMWLTDMGWIMGPWIVTAGLANGATVVTYDGAPDHPTPDRIWELVAKHRLTFLGISPTFIRSIQAAGAGIARRHDLGSLRAFGSTGEPWNPDPWWWLFREVGGERVPIVNLSGGTEIGACILSVNLMQGIKPTSVGAPALGMDAVVFDASGQPLGPGEGVGELAIRQSWPGMTRGFWKEPERYLDTYWRRFPGTWVHGDWASIDEDGFWYLHGRSDDTLNIAGKRIGPAEFESVAVALPGVVMAAAVGVPDPIKGEAVVIYVVPAPGSDHTAVPEAVAAAVTSTLGRAFRPKTVIVVDDLPRTRSAKIMRRVVRSLALGADPGDLSALENPDSLLGIGPL
jgi:acetyl-CoA synthetase